MQIATCCISVFQLTLKTKQNKAKWLFLKADKRAMYTSLAEGGFLTGGNVAVSRKRSVPFVSAEPQNIFLLCTILL